MRLTRSDKQIAAMSVGNMWQSDSVDDTWRSCCWQHTSHNSRKKCARIPNVGSGSQVRGHTRGL